MKRIFCIFAVCCALTLTGCAADKVNDPEAVPGENPAITQDENPAAAPDFNPAQAPQEEAATDLDPKSDVSAQVYKPKPITLPEGEITGEITVSSYYDIHRLLEPAIKAFEAKYPGTKVNVEKFEPLPIERTIEMDGFTVYGTEPVQDDKVEVDYIKRVNTQIMSGGGADILRFDIIPYYRYADAGYLVDLRQYMEQDPDFSMADYKMNVMDAVMYKGGQYIFPISFDYNFFAYDTTLITNIEQRDVYTFAELFDIGANAYTGDNRVFGLTGDMDIDYNGIWELLLEENYASFVDVENKKASFDDGRFEDLLLSVTEYNKKGYLYEWGEDEGYMERWERKDRFFFKYKVHDSLLKHFVRNVRDINSNLGGSPVPYGNDDDDEFAGLTGDYNGKALFKTRYSFAINDNSKNKRTAWEFIKFMTSYEIQSQTIYDIPVNKTALKDSLKANVEYFTSELVGDARFEAYLARADELSDKVNACVIRDYTIDHMIEDEVALYFSGKKSARDVANALQNKAKLYLSE